MVSSRPSRRRLRRRSNQISSSSSSSRASSSSASSSFLVQHQIERPLQNTKHTKWTNEKKRRAGGRFSLSIDKQKQQYEQKNFDVADDTDSCEKENDSSTLGRGSCIPRDRTTTTRRDFLEKKRQEREKRESFLEVGLNTLNNFRASHFSR